jgi:hypothetical protein
VHDVQPRHQLLDGISGPLRSPERKKKSMALYRVSEGAKGDWSVPPNLCLENVLFRDCLTVRPQCRDTPSCWKKTFG